ncbi:hypothetical protein ABLE91_07585 [Aquabacter sp. CN5-332]
MKRLTFAFCMLSVFAATAPAFAGDCPGLASTSTTSTTTTASTTTDQKGG